MITKFSGFFIVLFVFCLLAACQKAQDNNMTEISASESEGIPKKPFSSISFKEDYTLSEEWIAPVKLLPDDSNNLYVFDEGDKSPTIYKFDNNGKLIQKKSFSRGQGPGDINFMDPDFTSNGDLCIFDKVNQRASILNKELEPVDIIKFEKSIFNLKMDSNDYVFGFYSGTPNKEQRKNHEMPKILAKFSPEGKHLKDIFKYSVKFPKTEGGITYIYLYSPYCIFRIDENDNLYYADTSKYEIYVINPDGKMIKKISRKASPTEITPESMKDTGIRQIVWGYDNSFKWEFVPASQGKPYIEDFFVLGNGYILVLTYDYDKPEHQTIQADLFDEKGTYITKVEVPRYSFSYTNRPDYYFAKSRGLKKDYFYSAEIDDNLENYYVKRYKIVWK